MMSGVAPGASGVPGSGDDSRLALVALLIANLSVLVGVLWLGWDAVAVLLLYWHENLIIGVYTLLRMLRAGGLRALPLAVFFVFHFGMFCFVHGTMLLVLVLKGGAGGGDGPFDALQSLLTDFYASAPSSFFWSLAALTVSHGVSTVQHALVRNEDAGRSANAIMGDPYGRIVVMHLVVMAGAVAVVQLGSPQLLVLALVVLKVVLDVALHVRAHRRRRAKQAQPLPPAPSRSADVLAEEGVLLEDEAESRNTPPRRPRIRREPSGGA